MGRQCTAQASLFAPTNEVRSEVKSPSVSYHTEALSCAVASDTAITPLSDLNTTQALLLLDSEDKLELSRAAYLLSKSHSLLLSRPGVVSEQEGAHLEVQRDQEDAVAGRQPPPRRAACPSGRSQEGLPGPAAPSASLPHAAEGGDQALLLLWTISSGLPRPREELPLRLRVRTSARTTTGEQLGPGVEGTVVPAGRPNRPDATPVVPVSLADGQMWPEPRPGGPPVPGISRANVPPPSRLSLFHPGHPGLWVLGHPHGKQPTDRRPVPASGGLLERDGSWGLQGPGAGGAADAAPAPARAVPPGHPG